MENENNIIGVCKDCSDKIRKEFQKKNKNLIINIGDFVKIPVSDSKDTEHLWFEVTNIKGNNFIGRCDNDVVLISNMQFNGLHHFKFKDIEGYMKK